MNASLRPFALAAAAAACLAAALPAHAANLLANPSFEDGAPADGQTNHLVAEIPGWQMDAQAAGAGDDSDETGGGSGWRNWVTLDGGPGGPPADPQGFDPGHYFDVGDGAGWIYQSVTLPSCGPNDTRQLTLSASGFFSGRDGAVGTGRLRVREGAGRLGAVLAESALTPVPSGEWTQFALPDVQARAGSTVTLVAYLSNPTNFDGAELTVANAACPVPPAAGAQPAAVPVGGPLPWGLGTVLLAALGARRWRRRR